AASAAPARPASVTRPTASTSRTSARSLSKTDLNAAISPPRRPSTSPDERVRISARRSQFARELPHRVRFHGVHGHRHLFSPPAGGAFERPYFEASSAGRDARQRHPV